MRVPPTARFLPALITIAFMMMGLRGYDFWNGWNSVAQAEEHPAPVAPAHEEKPKVEVPKPEVKPEAKVEEPKQDPKPEIAAAPTSTTPVADAAAVQHEFSPAEIEVLQNLSKRRAELDQRASALDQQEAVLTAAAGQVDTKLKEMQNLKTELQTLLQNVDEQQKSRIASLVKIYETMKPREASAIIETLDMGVALSVLEQMKEAKSAPILASMSPQKASEITVEMSKHRQLPDVP